MTNIIEWNAISLLTFGEDLCQRFNTRMTFNAIVVWNREPNKSYEKDIEILIVFSLSFQLEVMCLQLFE